MHEIYRFQQRVSIYFCFRNLLHGLTIYMLILFLSHLSDFQHSGGRWLALVATAILIPLIYAVAVLVIDLKVHPEERIKPEWKLGVSTARVVLYNVVSSVLLIVFSPRYMKEVTCASACFLSKRFLIGGLKQFRKGARPLIPG